MPVPPVEAWRPSASIADLAEIAQLRAQIRAFFATREVMEVDTPVLGPTAACEQHIDVFAIQDRPLWLQASPEAYMKRLLAAGCGDIYQIAHAFRDEGIGSRHLREFQILEWYRLNWSYRRLMEEVSELVCWVLGRALKINQVSYAQAFQRYLGVDVQRTSIKGLAAAAAAQGIEIPLGLSCAEAHRDAWLDWLMAVGVSNHFAADELTLVYDYPASQAAFAELAQAECTVAQRFELYVGGLELANGYQELRDSEQQLTRMQLAADARANAGKLCPPLEQNLVAALRHGIPRCAGVAMGLDRLLMLKLGKSDIREVVAFADGYCSP